jgi:hypothetical protein
MITDSGRLGVTLPISHQVFQNPQATTSTSEKLWPLQILWHPMAPLKNTKKNLRVSSSAGATCSSPAAKSHWDRWVAVRPCGPRFRNHQAPGVLRARSRWAWKVHEGPVFTIGQHGSVFWYVLVNSNYLDSNASNFIKLFGNDILVEAMHVPTKRYVLLHAVPSAMCLNSRCSRCR